MQLGDVFLISYIKKAQNFSLWKKISSRCRSIANTDNAIDLSVDILLLVYDVVSSPILIVVRLIRFIFKKTVSKYLKRFLKWFVHGVLKIK